MTAPPETPFRPLARYAILVAGGKGLRMGSDIPKQFLLLDGRPVLYYAVRAFIDAFEDIRIVLVHGEGDAPFIRQVTDYFPARQFLTAEGGSTRFHSVQNGLRKVTVPSVVFVHDGVRPLVSPALICRAEQETLRAGSAIPVLEVKESIRRVHGADSSAEDRTHLRAVQTPQVFLSEVLEEAFRQPYDPAFTDEASVVERTGRPVHLIAGEERNLKITRPEDLIVAEALLHERSAGR